MKLLKFPWLVLINIVKFMDSVDLVNLSSTNRRLREQYINKIRPGGIGILFGSISACIKIGEFVIVFEKYGSYKETVPKEVRTIGPITIDAVCLPPKENKRWQTVVEDVYTPCLTLAQHIKTIFPEAELNFFRCEHECDAGTLQLLASWDLNMFKEKRFEFHVNSNENIKNLANQYCKSNQLSVIGLHYEGFHIVTRTKSFRNNEENELPVDSKFWFSHCKQLDRLINYILVCVLKVRLEAWRHLIKKWIEGKLNKLVFVRASRVTSLNMLELTEGFSTHPWNDEEMIQFKARTDFSVYFEQKGTIICSRKNRKASLHFDQNNSIFTMVVWDTQASERCLSLFPEIRTLF
ncbi:hypothetical protein GCK72_024938 [Caenorhabditis remanei]|uniref:F-box domain-containing protein n=1 Tax=Caenorhabditis remanei TaxID=31234 RepID=A0A6A5G139_CAERE|nr:hypothetical protein GCK72_024938 [Caenorhabditis remanei]KAF1748471.1 hypothetical protein GCK72_024938 [Caenorhabditis remanei]